MNAAARFARTTAACFRAGRIESASAVCGATVPATLRLRRRWAVAVPILLVLAAHAAAQIAVRGKVIYTMAGAPVQDGVVVLTGGKIAAIGPESSTPVPEGYRVLSAEVVTPGLIDAHTTVGLTGIYNQRHDQDMLEDSSAMQPQLRAIDAYNPQEELIEWLRSFGVTVAHTGHAPGELISGQTTVVKLHGKTIQDCVMVDCAAVACTLGPMAQKGEGKSPGTRGKEMALLRQELIKAQEYAGKREKRPATQPGADKDPQKKDDAPPSRDLAMETLMRVLKRELPLMVTANRVQDLASALRLAEEFKLRLWLDSASEAYLLKDEIRRAGVPVLIHPAMYRASGEMKNMSMQTAALLRDARIPVVFTSGYEDYVPKVRVVLFEAAVAAANGLVFEQALQMLTIDAARLLGIDQRVGSIEIGKDGDLALYDGDPFEYSSHCIGVVIDGNVVSDVRR